MIKFNVGDGELEYHWYKVNRYLYSLNDINFEKRVLVDIWQSRDNRNWTVSFYKELNHMNDPKLCKLSFPIKEFKVKQVQKIVVENIIRVLKIKAFC